MPGMVNTHPVTVFDDVGGGEPSLAERAYRAIRDMLVTLRIPPGSPLQEEQLTRLLDLGRTPVREAIKRLESERLVVIYPRRGTFASEVNITDLALISDVRLRMEPHAALRAAQRATAADRTALATLLGELPTGPDEPPEHTEPDPGELMRLDMRVHRAVYRCTHNEYLESTLLQYHNLATRIWCLFIDRLPGVVEHVAEHRSLLGAVVDGDGERAAQLAADHVAGFEQAVRSVT